MYAFVLSLFCVISTPHTSQYTETKSIKTDFYVYPVAGFYLPLIQNLRPEYAHHIIEEVTEDRLKSISDQRDWEADGSINQSSQFTLSGENAYIYSNFNLTINL